MTMLEGPSTAGPSSKPSVGPDSVQGVLVLQAAVARMPYTVGRMSYVVYRHDVLNFQAGMRALRAEYGAELEVI